jgi:hypothetical protein
LLIGRNGFLLLDILDGISTPAAVRELLMAKTLRKVWRTHYGRDNGRAVENRSMSYRQLPGRSGCPTTRKRLTARGAASCG